MTKFSEVFESFFISPAGISFLTWLQEQRDNERDKNENDPSYVSHGKAFREVEQYIDSVRVGMGRSSNGADKS